jgi:molybdenum cofactor cytidylyltransferase
MTRAAGVVLAAGLSRRFGRQKLLEPVEGRPLVLHTVDAARAAGLDPLIVVVSPDPGLRRALRGLPIVVAENPNPEAGLASSVRIGFRAIADAPLLVDSAVVLLGDQPRVRVDAIRALVESTAPQPLLVAAYADGSNPNPVLVHREAWSVADELTGDRGFGPWMTENRRLVGTIEVEGTNPDMDTPADLALLTWGDRVRGNHEQSERVREGPPDSDFYAPITSIFRSDPFRTGDAVLEELLEIGRPGERWLDIGGGAGRYALPLANKVGGVVVLDPSRSMLDALAEGIAASGIANVRAIEGRWPVRNDEWPADLPRRLDVALIANVGYDIADIGPFVDAMEAAADRVCVAVLAQRSPPWLAEPFWLPIHGEERVRLPAEPEFIELLRARGREPRERLVHVPLRAYPSRDDLHRWVRQQLFLAEGSERDRQLRELTEAAMLDVVGGVRFRHAEPIPVGVVIWTPEERRA